MAPLRLAAVSLAALSALSAACGSKKDGGPAVGVSGVPAPVARFSYDSLDDRPVSSDAMRGRVAVLAFVTTYDLASQAQVDFVAALAKRDPRPACAVVALQPKSERELVEQYVQALGVSFSAAMVDVGATGFGDVRVPTVIVLDAAGRIALRKEGIVKGDELARAVSAAAGAR